jgi:hypothetical protein
VFVTDDQYSSPKVEIYTQGILLAVRTLNDVFIGLLHLSLRTLDVVAIEIIAAEKLPDRVRTQRTTVD